MNLVKIKILIPECAIGLKYSELFEVLSKATVVYLINYFPIFLITYLKWLLGNFLYIYVTLIYYSNYSNTVLSCQSIFSENFCMRLLKLNFTFFYQVFCCLLKQTQEVDAVTYDIQYVMSNCHNEFGLKLDDPT